MVVADGVSANTQILAALTTMTAREKADIYFPRPAFCTDNGAMIAYAGCRRLMAGQSETLAIKARPRWPISELSGI